jgi:DeoR/GlpR family transcriptional regulator of sugar metabolism
MDHVRYTEAPQRRAELVRRIGATGYLSSTAAATALGVSEMTIRRDLRELAAQGLVNRVAGGASVATATPFEARRGAATIEKQVVARAAAGLLADDTTIALDAGTTVAALAVLLPAGITVLTHSVPVIVACAERPDLELIAFGGAYHAPTRSFTGPLTRAGLGQFAVDVAVLSATAADAGGAYSANAWDADTKRIMAGIAARVVLLLDHTKLGTRAPNRFLDLAAVDTVVVDAGAADHQLAPLRAHCRQVVIAS